MAASQSASGMQVFNIDGYGLHKGLGVGKFIRSPAFTVGGYDWCIRYYPDGDPDEAGAEESKEYFSVFLELLTKNAEVTASYRFSLEILVRATWQSSLVLSRMKPSVFNSVNPTWGDPKFRKWRQLEESHGNHMVHIRIVCDVTVIKETRVEETALAFKVQVPPSDLSDNLRKLLDDKEGADVTFSFTVKGKEKIIHAHKPVLRMRSPFFKEQPKTWWKEKMILKDIECDVFEALLHFIYTDSLPSMQARSCEFSDLERS